MSFSWQVWPNPTRTSSTISCGQSDVCTWCHKFISNRFGAAQRSRKFCFSVFRNVPQRTERTFVSSSVIRSSSWCFFWARQQNQLCTEKCFWFCRGVCQLELIFAQQRAEHYASSFVAFHPNFAAKANQWRHKVSSGIRIGLPTVRLCGLEWYTWAQTFVCSTCWSDRSLVRSKPWNCSNHKNYPDGTFCGPTCGKRLTDTSTLRSQVRWVFVFAK